MAQQPTSSGSNTPTPRSPTQTTEGPTTSQTTSADTSRSLGRMEGHTANEWPQGEPTAPGTPRPIVTHGLPDQTVAIVGINPSSLDSQFQYFAPVPTVGWAVQQPLWPTIWPPPPPPPPPMLDYAGQVPWKYWIENLAVRPYVTDPPPCPVVVSRYPGLARTKWA